MRAKLKTINDRQQVLAILAIAFLVRLIHLSSTPSNPLTYYPSADEDYYINFGLNVAQGHFGLAYDFIFMDPLYGYLLGIIFFLFGKNLLVVYLLQTILDTITVFLIYLVGKKLWSHRAGIIASCFYALSSTALMYTTKILKPTIVANFIILWSLLAIRMWKTEKISSWIWYGAFLGIGVAIRSNLLLIAIAGVIIVPWGNYRNNHLNPKQYGIRCSLTALGLSIPLILLGARNMYVTNNWLILPPNGGVVLHQIYNQENSSAKHMVPGFVRYSNPIEIWYDYRREAEKRLNRPLTVNEVNKYWRDNAIDYISSHPAQTIKNIFRKLGYFTSFKEISFNKSLATDELFSPILSFLPRPFGWLFAFGIPGLVLLGRKTPRSWPMIIAMCSTLATFVIFIAAARFRFHALPIFAVGSGVLITALLEWKHRQTVHNVAIVVFVVCLASTTLMTGMHSKENPIDLTSIAWGYSKIGQKKEAKTYALKELERNPNSSGAYELLGYIAFSEHRYKEAIREYRKSLKSSYYRHVVHYNLGLSLEKTGNIKKALDAVNIAVNLNPLPEYLYKQGELYEASDMPNKAVSSYKRLLSLSTQTGTKSEYYTKAKKRIRQIDSPKNEYSSEQPDRMIKSTK